MPRNGWAVDDSEVPDAIEEIMNAISTAADSGKLGINKDEAMKAFGNIFPLNKAQRIELMRADDLPSEPL
jgi:hypothetical protein